MSGITLRTHPGPAIAKQFQPLTDRPNTDGSTRRNSGHRSHLPDNGRRVRALRGSRRVAVETPVYGMNGRGAFLRDLQDVRVYGIPGPHHGLVLGLGPAKGRLHGHHPLALGGEAALLALAGAVLAVPLVALEGDFEPVVAAAGAVGRRPGGGRRAGGVDVHLRVEVLAVGGHVTPSALNITARHGERNRSFGAGRPVRLHMRWCKRTSRELSVLHRPSEVSCIARLEGAKGISFTTWTVGEMHVRSAV